MIKAQTEQCALYINICVKKFKKIFVFAFICF